MPKLEKLFICIGAQKAGTTWLFENLSQDPRFARCPFVKEIHYFDYVYNNSPHINNWRANFFLRLCQRNPEKLKPVLSAWLAGGRQAAKNNPSDQALMQKLNILLGELDDSWYTNLLHNRKNQCCAMDITPDYAVVSAEGFAHMKAVTGQLKILYILRDPAERAWSGLLQGKKNKPGGIDAFLADKGGDIDFLFKQCSSGADIGARNNYLMTLEKLASLGLTDKQQLLVKFYEDIATVPEQFITDIYAFLDMPCPPMTIFSDTLNTRIYATPKTPMAAELKARLKAHYADMINEINERFVPVPASWLN